MATESGGELLPGTLDVLVLKALSRGEKHGYAIVEFIHFASRDVLRVEEGALYPALHRLESRGLLDAEWGLSDNNRRAKFYRLSPLRTRRAAALDGNLGARRGRRHTRPAHRVSD